LNNKELLRQIVNSGEDIAFFIGAGASIPLGIQKWDEILFALGKTVCFSREKIENDIKALGYPGAASEIYNAIDDHGRYIQMLNEKFTPSVSNATWLHAKIVDWVDKTHNRNNTTIFTTNFDPSFEDVLKDRRINYIPRVLPDFNLMHLSDQPTIVYLHGNKSVEKYILRTEEYDTYYPSIAKNRNHNTDLCSYELENFLREIFDKIHLIFIGFSFNDKYFCEFLQTSLKDRKISKLAHQTRFYSPHPQKDTIHFAIVHNQLENQKIIDDMGIHIISYGDVGPIFKEKNHKEIITILSDIFNEPDKKIKDEVGMEASYV